MKPKPVRSLWPIAIATYFGIAIVLIATFIVWAVRQRDDLVSADYYEREVRYQSELDALNRSQAFAATSVVTFEPAEETIVVTLPVAPTRGATGSIQLYRPSDSRLDREFVLALNAEGLQRLDARRLRDGLWKVRVKWRVGDLDYAVDQPVIVTSHVASAEPPRE